MGTTLPSVLAQGRARELTRKRETTTLPRMIYLDHNATSPVMPEVADAMWPYLTEQWGNPSSTYRFGATAKAAVENARHNVAALINAQPDEILFTSGATEANNTAIHAALATQPERRHVITSKVEHSSVLGYCESLQGRGIAVTYLDVNREGQLDLAELSAAIRPDTAVVSLMWANNETGVIFPVAEIAALCLERGVRFHCDAVQAVGKLPVDLRRQPIDYLSLSAHKIGGPKGVGGLAIRTGTAFAPLLVGGKQEGNRRAGTESVPLIVGLGVACGLAARRGAAAWQPVMALRDRFETQIMLKLPDAYRNGAATPRLPNTFNFGLPGVDSDALVTYLDSRGVCVSSGSACMQSALAPSHVVLAMTQSHDRASEAVRISLALDTKPADLDHLVTLIGEFAALPR